MQFATEMLQFIEKEKPDQYSDREKGIMLLGALESVAELSRTNLSNIEIENLGNPVDQGKIAAYRNTFQNLEILLQKIVTDLDTLGIDSGLDEDDFMEDN